jgi:hypothetical protein
MPKNKKSQSPLRPTIHKLFNKKNPIIKKRIKQQKKKQKKRKNT